MQSLRSIGEGSVDLTRKIVVISVEGTAASKFEKAVVVVEFDVPRPKLRILAAHAGGCPGFVRRFDLVCEALRTMEGGSERAKRRAMFGLRDEVMELLLAIFENEKGEQWPGIKNVTLEMVREQSTDE
jgi:hypothetical protein